MKRHPKEFKHEAVRLPYLDDRSDVALSSDSRTRHNVF
ncbi:hypothetical protein DFR33_106162 [Bradymonas sediminis]|nr:hypothetical protein DFR33_106162 [Bradymonas sediminis]